MRDPDPEFASHWWLLAICAVFIFAGGIGLKREHKYAVMPHCVVASAVVAAGECK